MTSENQEQSTEIKDFVISVLEQVSAAASARSGYIKNTVKFELAVTKKSTGGGKLGVRLLEVVDVGGEKSHAAEHASTISFEIYPEDYTS